MSQLVHIQRNDFRGEINNFGGTFVTGAVFNSGGGNIFIGGRQTQDAWGIGQDILEREGLCVLSLEGGRDDGLSTLYFLGDLFSRLNAEREKSGRPTVKPCDVFDLIGGTGVGGFVAILLGQLQMDVADSIATYSKLMDAVNQQDIHQHHGEARSSSTKLEVAISEIIEAGGKPATHAFTVATDHGCRVVLCVIGRDSQPARRLQNYGTPAQSACQPTICEAVVATLAGTSFDRASGESCSNESGALGAMAMAAETAAAASEVWCSEAPALKSVIGCFVAIGAEAAGALIGGDHQHAGPPNIPLERLFLFHVHDAFRDCLTAPQQQLEAAMKEAAKEALAKSGEIVQSCIRALKKKQRKTDIAFEQRLQEYHHNRRVRPENAHEQQACWNVPFRKNQRFVGRENVLQDLDATLFNTGDFAKAAIVGLGGIGKTQIALELAHRTRKRWPDCSVFWVPAISLDTVRKAYLDIGKQLQVPGLEDDAADMLGLVRQRLSLESTGRWLFILDNTDDVDMCFTSMSGETGQAIRLADYLPQSALGSVLITTRSRKVAVRMTVHKLIEVTEMDEETATELLRHSLVGLELPEADKTVVELLKELTFLLLAIVQAAAYINENCISLAQYIDLLNEAEETTVELLSEDFEDEGRYRGAKNPVAKTWLVSFEQIRRHNPLAVDYLSFMSCLEPRMIPQSLLPNAPSRKKMLEAMGTLTAYSFISKEADDQFYSIHRLVHLATRNWSKEEGMLANLAIRVLARLTEVFPDNSYTNRNLWRIYLPHALFVLALRVVELDREKKMMLQARCGHCLLSDGRYREAEELFVHLLEQKKEMLGHEHPDTLTSMNNYAAALWKQGQWKVAEELELQVNEMRKRVLGPDHPDTLVSSSNLAVMYRCQGRWKEAEVLGVEVSEKKKSALGQEHPQTLVSIEDMAFLYWKQGRWKEAEELGVHVLETRKRVLGEEHPDTVSSICSLAVMYRDQGRWKDAEEMFIQAIAREQMALGQEHPDVLKSMMGLAATYADQGRWKEGEEMEVQVIAAEKKVLGLEHRDTLTSMSNHAVSLGKLGRWKEAEEQGLQVLETRKRLLGLEHPDTLISLSILSKIYRDQGQWKTAEELGRQVVESRKKILGLEHRDTLNSLGSYAVTLGKQGRWEEAEELELQVMETLKRVLGKDHPDTLTSMSNLASTYLDQRRWKEAEELQAHVLAAEQREFGPEHPSTLKSMNNLASTYMEQGRWKEAENMEQQVMETMKMVLGPEHPDTLSSMVNLAFTFSKCRRWKEAENLEAQAVETMKRVLGHEHPSTLGAMSNLAMTLQQQGRWNDAKELYEQVAATRKRVIGPEHRETLTSMGHLASLYGDQGRWKEAEELEVQVFEARKRVLGPEHPATLNSMGNLVLMILNQGRRKEAEELYVQVLEKMKR